jgi:hypothetical protein
MAKDNRATVKLPSAVYEQARDLSALASQHGWATLGVKRDDPPTVTAIFEEAIKQLALRAKPKAGK